MLCTRLLLALLKLYRLLNRVNFSGFLSSPSNDNDNVFSAELLQTIRRTSTTGKPEQTQKSSLVGKNNFNEVID